MKIRKLVIIISTLVIFTSCKNDTTNDNESFKISAILSLSGNAATLGEYAKKGIELAIIEKNENGGLLNKPVEAIYGDSQTQPKEGVNIAQKHLAEFEPLLMYCQLSSISLAVKPLSEKNNQLMFALSGADNLLLDTKSTFRNWLPPLETARELSRIMKDSLFVNQYGILFSNGEFSRSMKDAAVEESTKNDMDVLFTEVYDEQGADFKTVVLKCLDKNPDHIYVIGIGKSLGKIIKDLRESGYKGTILGDATMSLPDVRNTAGTSINGAYYIDFGFSNDSEYKNTILFKEKFIELHDKEPQTLSAISYDAMNILFDAVERTGLTDSNKIIEFLNDKYEYNGVFGDVKISSFDIIYPMILKKYE